jgi:hypothetical protein
VTEQYATWFHLNALELAGVVTVVATRPALEHGLFKDLSVFVMNAQAWRPTMCMLIGKYV